MKRLARVNGNLRVICTSEEFSLNGFEDKGMKLYPILTDGEPDVCKVIIQNGDNFNSTTGQTTSNMERYSFG